MTVETIQNTLFSASAHFHTHVEGQAPFTLYLDEQTHRFLSVRDNSGTKCLCLRIVGPNLH